MNIEAWWGKRWIEDLERLSTAWQSRLPRGQDYANKGHVLSITVSSGKISAQVQGSRSKPYTTDIEVQTNKSADWDRLFEKLAKEARYPAQLLDGEMPHDLVDLCKALGLSLFPTRNSELIGRCSCPDKGRPCKHIAAVHYAFGEALDRDPSLLFQVRGANRDTLLMGFYRAWFGRSANVKVPVASTSLLQTDGVLVANMKPDRFNRSPEPLASLSFDFTPPDQPHLVLTRLGKPRPWHLPISVFDLLGPVYDDASKMARNIALSIDQLRGDHDDQADEDFDDDFADDFDDEDDDDLDDDSSSYVALQVNGNADAAEPAEPPPVEAATRSSKDKSRDSSAISDLRLQLPTNLMPRKVAPDEAPPMQEESKNTTVLIRRSSGDKPQRRQRKRGQSQPEPLTVVRRVTPASTQPTLDEPQAAQPTSSAGIGDGDSNVDHRVLARALEQRGIEALSKGEADAALADFSGAWRAKPTLDRYRLLIRAAERADKLKKTVKDEAAWLLAKSSPARQAMGTLELLPLLAAGAYADAAERMERVGDSAWSEHSPYGHLFVPFVLRALYAKSGPAPDTALASLLQGLNSADSRAFQRMDDPPPSTLEILEQAAMTYRTPIRERERLLDLVESLVVGLQKSREATIDNASAHAAIRYTAALLETLLNRKESDRFNELLSSSSAYLRRQPRLNLALDEAIERWPILADDD